MLLADDDLFSPFDEEEVEKLSRNPNLCLWISPGGGHTDFTQSFNFGGFRSFITPVTLQYARLLQDHQNELKAVSK